MQLDLDAAATQRAFAKLVGVSAQNIGLLAAKGVLKAGAPLGEWLSSYCANLRAAAAGRAPDTGVSGARKRLLVAQALHRERENLLRSRRLLDAGEVDRVWGRGLIGIRDGLLGGGARVVAPIRAASSEAVALALYEREVHRLLSDAAHAPIPAAEAAAQ